MQSLLLLALTRASLGLGFDDRHLRAGLPGPQKEHFLGVFSHLGGVVGWLFLPLTPDGCSIHYSWQSLSRLLTLLGRGGKVGSGLLVVVVVISFHMASMMVVVAIAIVIVLLLLLLIDAVGLLIYLHLQLASHEGNQMG